jgi:hypothetical protein
LSRKFLVVALLIVVITNERATPLQAGVPRSAASASRTRTGATEQPVASRRNAPRPESATAGSQPPRPNPQEAGLPSFRQAKEHRQPFGSVDTALEGEVRTGLDLLYRAGETAAAEKCGELVLAVSIATGHPEIGLVLAGPTSTAVYLVLDSQREKVVDAAATWVCPYVRDAYQAVTTKTAEVGRWFKYRTYEVQAYLEWWQLLADTASVK